MQSHTVPLVKSGFMVLDFLKKVEIVNTHQVVRLKTCFIQDSNSVSVCELMDKAPTSVLFPLSLH